MSVRWWHREVVQERAQSREEALGYERLVPLQTHHCCPPGWRKRRRDRVGAGTIWRCPECGGRWRWEWLADSQGGAFLWREMRGES